MSFTAGLSTAALADGERADIRRYAGYDMYGPGNAGFVGDRFYQAYGVLEYKMTNARPEELQVMRFFLNGSGTVPGLYALEGAVASASANLDTDSAAVWVHNRNEVRDRSKLLDQWCRRLCRFFGIPPGPGLGEGGVSFVV